MKRVLITTFLIVVPSLLLANGDDMIAKKYLEVTGHATDIGPRIFNFVLLVGLLWYLLANPIKNFLANRSKSIESELNKIENIRQEAIDKKEEAEYKLRDAETKAVEIIEDAKREAELLKSKIESATQEELANLEKIYNEKIEIDRKQAIKETTKRVLNDNISADDIPLDSGKIVEIVSREVA